MPRHDNLKINRENGQTGGKNSQQYFYTDCIQFLWAVHYFSDLLTSGRYQPACHYFLKVKNPRKRTWGPSVIFYQFAGPTGLGQKSLKERLQYNVVFIGSHIYGYANLVSFLRYLPMFLGILVYFPGLLDDEPEDLKQVREKGKILVQMLPKWNSGSTYLGFIHKWVGCY